MLITEEGALELINGPIAQVAATDAEVVATVDGWLDETSQQNRLDVGDKASELQRLAKLSAVRLLNLTVASTAQSLRVTGYRKGSGDPDSPMWRTGWLANGLDARQHVLARTVAAYGCAYAVVLPGVDPLTGEKIPSVRFRDPATLTAVYLDEQDAYPYAALDTLPQGISSFVRQRLYVGGQYFEYVVSPAGGRTLVDAGFVKEGLNVVPVVRYAVIDDTRGTCVGRVLPNVTAANRARRSMYERLKVQRYQGSMVRTIAGIDLEEEGDDSQTSVEASKRRLSAEDILVAPDPETRFGALPAAPLDPLIAATEADLRLYAATSQTSAHHLLGQLVNVGPDAVAASRASGDQLNMVWRAAVGAGHAQMLRLCAVMVDDEAGATDTTSTVRWADTTGESRAAKVDALGKAAQMLHVPDEMLWSELPGWDQGDVDRARRLRDAAVKASAAQQLVQSLNRGAQPVDQQRGGKGAPQAAQERAVRG